MHTSLKRTPLILLALVGMLLLPSPGAMAQGTPGSVAPPARLSEDHGFVASSRGRVYYPRSCDAWRELAPANLIGFVTEEDARAAGYVRTTNRACGRAPAALDGRRVDHLPAPGSGDSLLCTVASVTDGDTIACVDGRRVRLLLIDAPEMSQGPFGREARAALAAMLPPATPARLEMDLTPTDRYGRTLAYVYDATGLMVNEEMARLGFALQLTYPPNVRYVERIAAAVEEARAERRGLWSGSAFDCTPRDYRARRCGQ